MNVELAGKYDRISERFSETSYANLAFDMERRLFLATTWGKPLDPGDSVLELGCGDGYLARLFVERGLRYWGVDMSSGMVATAERRLSEAGLKANFTVTDVSQLALSETVDAVVSFMGTFFFFIGDPLAVLKTLRPYIRKKVILDLNPRQNDPRVAVEILKQAGFTNVAWRPFLVSKDKKLPVGVLKTLVACEDIPILRSIPLHWKFFVLLKGEVG
jgi:SAM-dependent methyltransferase